LYLNRCHVAPSTIPQAGHGLFASRKIYKDELITLYPGDALLLWNKSVGDFSGDVGVLFGNHVQDRNVTKATSDETRNYEIKINDMTSLVADPNCVNDPAYLAHMMNDGAPCWQDSFSARSEYSQRTVQKYNAAIVPIQDCHYAAVATKDIQANQEIFVSYGEGYWLSRLRKQTTTTGNKQASANKSNGATKKSFMKTTVKVKRGGGGGGRSGIWMKVTTVHGIWKVLVQVSFHRSSSLICGAAMTICIMSSVTIALLREKPRMWTLLMVIVVLSLN
jgi:hypothetical protein